MSTACVLQPPVGLGLRKDASFSKIIGLRKRAAVPMQSQATVPYNRSFIDKLPSNFPVAQQQADPQPQPQQQTSYGLGDRLSDIWSFIKNGLTMLWHRRGMKEGTLTPEQWRSVQESATALGNNRTLKDLYKWWNGDQQGEEKFKRISGLAGVTQNMPHLYKLRDTFKGGVNPSSLLAARNYWKENNLDPRGLRSTLDYGKQYGYLSDKDYDEYTSNLDNLSTVMGF